MARDFFNVTILGGQIAPSDGRVFRPVRTDNLADPQYDHRYFETFPTVWAAAYAFRKAIEMGDAAAIEEWACLFLLFYFGGVKLDAFSRDRVTEDFDKDLWDALSGTFPKSSESPKLEKMLLLKTEHDVVVGAYYPSVVFFPARGRNAWAGHDSIQQYLEGGRLSWAKCSQILEQDANATINLHTYLRRVARYVIQRGELKTRLDNFCTKHFGALTVTEPLVLDPEKHETLARASLDPVDLLREYPLQKENKKGGKTYYLINDMPLQSGWMTQLEAGRPAPSNFAKTGPSEISIKFAGRTLQCALDDQKDEIVSLRSLFLSRAPFWCKIPREGNKFTLKSRSLHDVALKDNTLKQTQIAVCLFPVERLFLEHFEETFFQLKDLRVTPLEGGRAEWIIPILGKEIRWQTSNIASDGMPKTTLSMWPPHVSPDWKFYSLYGTGSKDAFGRWHLIDENGGRGQYIEIEEDEYVSVLHREGEAHNRPKALLCEDAANNERGILFLNDFADPGVEKDQAASLAVDLGTSNTCMAVQVRQSSEILRFSLSPLSLWGEVPDPDAPRAENPGFVPTQWGGGDKGFFPTILLSRKKDENLPTTEPDRLQLDHLFKVDIPSLHKGIERRLYEGALSHQWRIHTNLKWSTDSRTPWRSLFLELTLLYAHAEIFFNRKAFLTDYIFTYPLAFAEEYGDTYHEKAKDAIKKIRNLCYGDYMTQDKFTYRRVNESSAIANYEGAAGGAEGLLEVFVDIGGGTADVAIRHNRDFLVLDSIKVAGKSFFKFSKKNFVESNLFSASKFKKHLGQLLQNKDQELNISNLDQQLAEDLGNFYSVAINNLDDKTFREKENHIIQKTMADKTGDPSFQRYRSYLFFRHILAYAILQACAATIANKINLTSGVKLILGGNGWGLVMFAELQRSASELKQEAGEILELLKRQLENCITEDEKPYLESVKIDSVVMLNEGQLSMAKTSVALGALQTIENEAVVLEKAPYTGITITGFSINRPEPAITLRWCERWSLPAFRQAFNMNQIDSAHFDQPKDLRHAMDPIMAAFTALGNEATRGVDNTPSSLWTNINTRVITCVTGLKADRRRLSQPPPINFFLSEVLYYPDEARRDPLDELARINGNYDADSKKKADEERKRAEGGR